MKIGYTINKHDELEWQRLYEEGNCDLVVQAVDGQSALASFSDFVMAHTKDELVVVNLESIGLQISQILPVMTLMEHEKVKIHFIEKEVESDETYFFLLKSLANREKSLISMRTQLGLRRALKKGKKGGRPQLSQQKIDRIQFMFTKQKKSLREIANACEVSLGTAHKYTRELVESPSVFTLSTLSERSTK